MKALPTLSMICLLLCGCSDDGTRELWKKYDEEQQLLEYIQFHLDDADFGENLDTVRDAKVNSRRRLLKILRQIDKINPAAKHPTTGDSVFTLMDKYD